MNIKEIANELKKSENSDEVKIKCGDIAIKFVKKDGKVYFYLRKCFWFFDLFFIFDFYICSFEDKRATENQVLVINI